MFLLGDVYSLWEMREIGMFNKVPTARRRVFISVSLVFSQQATGNGTLFYSIACVWLQQSVEVVE